MPDEKEGGSFADLFAESMKKAPKRARLQPGERLEVTVSKIGKESVFVELDDKQEGFIERVDLTNADGELTVSEGSRIVAKIVEVGCKAGAVRLAPLAVKSSDDENALVQAAPQSNEPVLVAGMKVKGHVARVERYGVFVQIVGTQGRKGRGLIPAVETGAPRGADLHKLFPVGQELEAKILAVDEEGKIRLSVTALARDEERGAFEAFAKKDKPEEGKGNPRSLGTFGDLLAKKGIGKK